MELSPTQTDYSAPIYGHFVSTNPTAKYHVKYFKFDIPVAQVLL